MKSLMTAWFLILTSLAFGQDEIKPAEYSKVIQADSLDKTALFVSLNDWFATTYNSANDVIQMADKEAGKIIGKGSFSFSAPGGMWSPIHHTRGNVRYTISVTIRDNRYKVEIENFNHKSTYYQYPHSLGIVTNAKTHKDKGFGYKAYNEAWTSLKARCWEYANNIFADLEAHTSNIEKEDEW